MLTPARSLRILVAAGVLLVACDGAGPAGPVPGEPSPVAASPSEAERLARTWIDYWNRGTPRDLPLAESFVHTSPFGRIEGRETYLATVIPLAEQNVVSLTVRDVIASGNQAAIFFDMQTPHGTLPVCDRVVVSDGQIVEIHSYYDATTLRDSSYQAAGGLP